MKEIDKIEMIKQGKVSKAFFKSFLSKLSVFLAALFCMLEECGYIVLLLLSWVGCIYLAQDVSWIQYAATGLYSYIILVLISQQVYTRINLWRLEARMKRHELDPTIDFMNLRTFIESHPDWFYYKTDVLGTIIECTWNEKYSGSRVLVELEALPENFMFGWYKSKKLPVSPYREVKNGYTIFWSIMYYLCFLGIIVAEIALLERIESVALQAVFGMYLLLQGTLGLARTISLDVVCFSKQPEFTGELWVSKMLGYPWLFGCPKLRQYEKGIWTIKEFELPAHQRFIVKLIRLFILW